MRRAKGRLASNSLTLEDGGGEGIVRNSAKQEIIDSLGFISLLGEVVRVLEHVLTI